MKNFKQVLVIVTIILLFSACANKPTTANQPADNPQVIAIKNFRLALGLPDLPLESQGMEHMINSPSGDLPVAIYVDSEGRKYSVEPLTNTIVEIDARNLLASIPADAPSIPQDELKARGLEIAKTTTPNFDSLFPSLIDDGGSKGDYYFFDWRKPILPGEMMPPFLQIGFDKSGLIFAYINTLSLK